MTETNKPKETKWISASKLQDGERLVFKLKDTKVTEQFAIWDVQEKKMLKEKKDKIELDTGVVEVSKYISFKSLSENDKKRYRRVVGFVRDILTGPDVTTPKILTINFGVNKSILSIIENLSAAGVDPISKTLVLTKTGKGLATKYDVFVKPVTDSQPVQITLTDTETALLTEMNKSEDVKKASKQQKIEIMIRNGIKEERAKVLVERM